MGRPDILISALSSSKLGAWRRLGLDLRTPAEAKVLEALVRGRTPSDGAGITPTHATRIVKRLNEQGWLTASNRLVVSPPFAHQSLVIEAKVNDWQRGLAQLAKQRRFAHQAALLLPADRVRLVNRRFVERHGFGLMSADGDDVRWVRRPRPKRLSLAEDLWIASLLVRKTT